MFSIRRRLLLPAAACALLAGCGSSTPARRPTVGEMARLRAHLADAHNAAATGHRQAAIDALRALANDITALRGEGRLTAPFAATLATDVAQARRRALVELPAPSPTPAATVAAPVATATTTTPAPATAPAAAPVPAPGPALAPGRHHGLPGAGPGDGHGKGKGRHDGGGDGGD